MALLTDGQVNNTQDLRNYENSILDFASLESIDLTGKMALAQDEIATKILQHLLRHGTRDPKAFPYIFLGESLRRRTGVSDVVITTELKRWHAFMTLELAYADAYSSQLNDRYVRKQKQYQSLADAAALSFFETGVGISLDPLGRALAPSLGFVSGVGAATTFYVQIAWTNRAGQESVPSELVSFSTSSGTQLTVNAVEPAPNAVGWNVYAGYTPDQLSLQNDVPIAVLAGWVAPPSGLRAGRNPGYGQTADRFIVNDRVLLRG